jgi:hypothetical protein
MKTILLIILFVSTVHSSWGQKVYTSPFSVHQTTQIVERIPRTITITDSQITIESIINKRMTDIQIMIIQTKEVSYENNIKSDVYQCTSPDGMYPSTVIIEENPGHITVLQPSLNEGQMEEYRLMLEIYN